MRPRFWQLMCSYVMTIASVMGGELQPTGRALSLCGEHNGSIPDAWQIQPLPTGKPFHLATYFGTFRSTVQTPDGLRPMSSLPWAKEAIVRVSYGDLKDPIIYRDLLENKSNPIMFFGSGHHMQPYMYPGLPAKEIEDYFQLVLKAKQEFGPRFLCLDYCEWSWGGVGGDKPTRELTESLPLLKLAAPRTRDEAIQWWDRTYDLTFQRYQEAGIPILSWNATSLNHHEARKESSWTGNEIAYVNAAMDSVYYMFARGAARQYGIPWGMYAAGFGGHFGHNDFTLTRSPSERRARADGILAGAYGSVPLQEQRRTLYTTYMSGANFHIKESDGAQGMLSSYDPEFAEKAEPRVQALQDDLTHLGPYGRLYGELWDTVVQRHDRGTPYTPIALLLDRHHGYAFKYSKTLTVGGLPYTDSDNQMRAITNTIFPWEKDSQAVGPYGELFDALTTDASEDILRSYRAIVLVGQIHVDDRLAQSLKRYVEQGGLLLACCEQLTPELWKLAGIADTGEVGQDKAYLRAADFYAFPNEPFTYHRVTLDDAEPLFLANDYDQRQWPVATIHHVGRGTVIVGTPVWMNVAGDPTRMHGVFAELMTMLRDELSPVRVHGSPVKVMFNRNAAGWVVTLMNVRGTTIAYPGFRPATRAADTAGVVLEPKFAYDSAMDWRSTQTWPGSEQQSSLSLIIPPGEFRIIEFQTVKGTK